MRFFLARGVFFVILCLTWGWASSPEPTSYFAKKLAWAKEKSYDDQKNNYSSRAQGVYQFASCIKRYSDANIDISPIYDELVNFLLNDPYPNVRAAAAEVLPLTGKSEAVAQLQKALKDKSILVRLRAASAIIKMGNTDDMTALPVLASIATSETMNKLTREELINSGIYHTNIDFGGKKGGIEIYKLMFQSEAVQNLIKSKTNYAKLAIKEIEKNAYPEVKTIIANNRDK